MIILDLPAPPTVNRMSRSRRGTPLGNKSPAIRAWAAEADAVLEADKAWRKADVWPIGHFDIEIIFTRNRCDLDNRIKPILDYLQSRGFIENDRLCDQIIASWGNTPLGCRIILNSA